MKALVTGAAGFVGSTLVDKLLADGHEVVGVDSFEAYYSPELKLANLAEARTAAGFRLVEASILDLAADDAQATFGTSVDALIAEADTVFHLAAQPGVRGSWGQSFSAYTNNNVLATQVLLESSKRVGRGPFVYASSSSVYGDTDVFPMHEDAVCRPYSPYGVTKLAAEHLCRLYARNFSLHTVSLRFFTVYGPRQRPDMAFNKFILAALEGSPIEVYGDGAQTRDFTFVADIVDGLVAAPAAPAGSVMNLGGGSRVTLEHALAVLSDVMGTGLDLRFGDVQAGDVHDTWASIDAAAELIGYAPSVPLEEGLRAEYEWIAAGR